MEIDKVLATACTNETETYEDARIHKDIGLFKYIHRYLVKPIFHYGSSLVLRKAIIKAIGDVKGKTILDVSTGDDELVLDMAKTAKKVIANDISIHSLLPIIKKSNGDDISFMNQNLLDLKIPQADIVICKNTLHHFTTISQLKRALRKLSRLGKKIIIMDIEAPKLTNKARFWNAYYTYLLKDQGGFFIDYNQFKVALRSIYKQKSIKFSKIDTIKGFYMLAVIKHEA